MTGSGSFPASAVVDAPQTACQTSQIQLTYLNDMYRERQHGDAAISAWAEPEIKNSDRGKHRLRSETGDNC